LARREFLNGGKELPDVLPRRHQQEHAFRRPTLVLSCP
jgi:hypothetical protein